jgi:hypothetical protein
MIKNVVAMFKKILPHNNDWNRKYNFIDENTHGFLMDIRNGLAFFGWIFSGEEARFYKCEEEVFKKSFDIVNAETVSYEMDPYDNISFKRYPMEK